MHPVELCLCVSGVIFIPLRFSAWPHEGEFQGQQWKNAEFLQLPKPGLVFRLPLKRGLLMCIADGTEKGSPTGGCSWWVLQHQGAKPEESLLALYME